MIREPDQEQQRPPAPRTFPPRSGLLALGLLWSLAALGLYGLGPGGPVAGLLLWALGLALAARLLRGLRTEIARRDQALKELGERAEQMERRVAKRSASLQLRQLQLQALMDNLKPGAYIKNSHHEFILVNARLCAMLEAPAERMLGSRAQGLLNPEVAAKIAEAEQRVARDKRALQISDLFGQSALPEGRIADLFIFPVLGPDEALAGTGGLLQDATDHHQQERELIRARAEAHKAAQAKSSFLANISHEIRTPLNGIIGTADLLARSELNSDQASMAAVIKNAGDALLGALNDVLDLSKVESGKMQLNARPFSLRGLIFESLKGLTPIAHSKKLELNVKIAPQIPDELYGDDLRLRQILVNLVSNALKFTNQGEVRITVSPRDEAEPREPAYEPEGEPVPVCRLRLSVSDTGIGIPENKRKIIFEAFEQADTSSTRNYGGAGLGLAISYHLAAMMNSKLRLESAEGRGSTFWLDLELPVISETRPPQSQNAYESFQGHHILCVDDSEEDRQAIMDQLRERGIRAQGAGGADEALNMMKSAAKSGQPFGLVLAEVRLRLEDGRDLFTALAGEPDLADTPLVALTSTHPLMIVLPPDRPIVAQLLKPVSPPDLIRTLAAALGVWESFDSSFLAAGLSAETTQISSRRLKILLTEDMEVNQIVARRMLEELGHRVTVASNGAEALDLFREQDFDLILMDIQMPVMDGLTAAAKIRQLEFEQRRPHTPVAAITAHALQSDREKYLAQGMDDYLSKPLLMSDLAKLIEDQILRWNLRGEPNTGPPPAAPAGKPRGAAEIGPSSPLIDFELTKRSFGANRQVLRKSMELYLRDAPLVLGRISAALDEGQLEEAASQAHALKGISSYYSQAGPYRLAMELDQRSRQAHWPEDRPALTRLTAELRSAVEALMAEMKSYLSYED